MSRRRPTEHEPAAVWVIHRAGGLIVARLPQGCSRATLPPVNYVPGLDGLRAVAVIAVLAFHAQFAAASGGFLGVSLFFTLVGVPDHDPADRRARLDRNAVVAPVLRAPCTTAAAGRVRLLGCSWCWPPDGGRRASNDGLPGDLVASVANVANWRFAFAPTSYQELFLGEPSPVAHFWSLAIEEQIYLVLPVVVYLALRRGPRALAATTGVLLAASIAATLLTTDRDLVYNGTHTRAAELLVGVALAQVLRRRPMESGRAPVVDARASWPSVASSCWSSAASVQQEWIYRGGLVGVVDDLRGA